LDLLEVGFNRKIRKAKRANPQKWICPYRKTISQLFKSLDISGIIEDIQNYRGIKL
jgi:hypothetical protein